jgi:hypothetical protein
MRHVIVYRRDDEFCGWPFNGGMWQFADGEIAVGFVRNRVDYADPATFGHAAVDCQGGEHVVIRSKDGGATWDAGDLSTVYRRPALDAALRESGPPVATGTCASPPDAAADGFCLIAGYGIPPHDAPDIAFTTVSADRGRTWSTPVRLPAAGFENVGGRPSYLRRPDGLLLLFAHASRVAAERRAVPVVYGSSDGGGSWSLLAEVVLSPPLPMGIMPYPLQLADGTIVIAVRRQYSVTSAFTQVYASTDQGRSWCFRSRVNDWGAPASLTLLNDGRIVCVYGYRQAPYGIRARVSADQCRTWDGEIVLRADGGSWDLGYPRTVCRTDGSLVTVYYFNTADDPGTPDAAGVRHIAATLWSV